MKAIPKSQPISLVHIMFLMLFFSPLFTNAQTNIIRVDSFPEVQPPSLFLIAKNYEDSVVLRWAPREPAFWKVANESGYIIRRHLMEGNKPAEKIVFENLNTEPLRPWTLEEWKAKSKQDDTLAAMAAQILHGASLSNERKEEMSLDEIMNTKIERDNKHGFALIIADQSAFVADGLALRYVDRTVEKGKKFVYTVHALVDSNLYRSDTAAVFINTSEVPLIPNLPPITVEQTDKAVKFSWDREAAGMFFSAYILERSEDNGKTFKKVSEQPFVQPVSRDQAYDNPPIVIIDSLQENYKSYIYRIYGITPFGEPGPPSENLPVMGKDLTPPSPPQEVMAENFQGNVVRITWSKTMQEKDFAGFLIGRSQNVDGPYIPLNLDPLPKNAGEFIDNEAVPHGTNYYVVAAVDTAKNAGLSIPAYVIMIDETPPAKPEGLTGKIDTTGIVSLEWKIGEEADLLGYMIYYANAPDHAFTPVSEGFIADTTFKDSISFNNLTKNIYYRIVAFDKNRNPSPYSEILELKKPDKIPPVQAVFSDYAVSDTSVFFSWAPSSSNDLDIQVLYRKENDGEWIEFATLDKDIDQFTDTQVKRNSRYEYSIVSVDDSGLQSPFSFSLNIKIIDSGVRETILSFEARPSLESKAVELVWKYPVDDDFQFIIYRSFNESGLITYKAIDSEAETFTDFSLLEGEYQYAIKAVYKDGGESPLAKTEIVKLGNR